MDRWSWMSGPLSNEVFVQQTGTKLYDGDEKTAFDNGSLLLTSRSLVWIDSKKSNCALVLGLRKILQVKHVPGGIMKSPQLVLHLARRDSDQIVGPIAHSRSSFIKISFKNGGEEEFQHQMMVRLREQPSKDTRNEVKGRNAPSTTVKGSGIVGIERKIEAKQKETDQNISVAFQDLSKLMEKAKEMVKLSQAITVKIKDKTGEITEDETVKFKSYLLSLGIENPVTKETHGSLYHTQLAREICNALLPALQKNEGILLLSDAYCMINRARGFELLSPDDLINACKLFVMLKLPVRFKTYESGVSVIQLETHSEERAMEQTVALVNDSGSLSAQQLANLVEISVFLAKERLILAEKHGKLCRDETVEGLRFFYNKFLF